MLNSESLIYFRFYVGTPNIPAARGRIFNVPADLKRSADLMEWFAETLALGPQDSANYNALKWYLVPEHLGGPDLHLVHADLPMLHDPYEPESYREYLAFLLHMAKLNDPNFQMWSHFPEATRFLVVRALSVNACESAP